TRGVPIPDALPVCHGRVPGRRPCRVRHARGHDRALPSAHRRTPPGRRVGAHAHPRGTGRVLGTATSLRAMSPPPRRKRASRVPDGAATRGGAPAQERELRAQGKKTMRKLLDAAMDVFDRRGYHAARVDDIVKVARTSHGTFYLYFANKEDLFRALATDVAEEMTALAESLGPVGPDRSGYEELRGWMSRFSVL